METFLIRLHWASNCRTIRFNDTNCSLHSLKVSCYIVRLSYGQIVTFYVQTECCVYSAEPSSFMQRLQKESPCSASGKRVVSLYVGVEVVAGTHAIYILSNILTYLSKPART